MNQPARLANLYGQYCRDGFIILTAGREVALRFCMPGDGLAFVRKNCALAGKRMAIKRGVKWCGMHRNDKLDLHPL